ncbi:glucosaminidase domain-containing protein [Sphingobacterium rhinopitheci]|uniref:glucosaminidase domain-containing protein n=1 Tax=Sphingobacterium rhinopitheci TaxID=2781960 RepID=UPI001F516094|nr:glucosaminidase domain-containing protein [Sphingobacterium rhinopitheci]MCI0921561.1 glucosaminidase domain-containing protein [Sphingobacterium rhinopitheci]
MRIIVLSLLMICLMSSCASKKNTVLRNPSSVSKERTKETHSMKVHTPKKETHPTKSHQKAKEIPNLSASSGKKGTSVQGLNYIDAYKSVAIREMNQYGIPASIKLAQALLESGNGNSYLAIEANNHFGIKCGGVWSGKSIARDDDNPNDCFRVYDNVEASYKDHSQFLLRKRYEKLFSLAKDDYKGWAKGLKEAGYATNPRYPQLLIDIIERYDLHQYDSKESSVEHDVRQDKVIHLIEDKIVSEPVVKAEQIKTPLAMVIHEVKASQTLYGISKQYKVTVEQIKSLNNLSTDNLTIGQYLVISK